MTETEIERLVVRLVGDGSEYVKMLKDAQAASQQAAKSVEQHGKHIEGFKHKLESWAEKVEGTLLKVGLAIGAWEAFEKFDEVDQTLRHLGETIEWNGEKVDETLKDYKKFTETIYKNTTMTKTQTLNLLEVAGTFKLTGEAAKTAVSNAINLAAATGNSAETMLKMSQAMAKGNIEAAETFKRMVPQLRNVKTEAEFAAEYEKLVALGAKRMAGDADDATGRLEKMKGAIGGLAKIIGEHLSRVIEPAIVLMTDFLNSVALGNPTVRSLAGVLLTAVTAGTVLLATWGYLSSAATLLTVRLGALKAGLMAGTAWMSTYSIATNAATIATKALSAAAMATPWVLIIALIGTAVSTIYRAKEAYKEFKDQLDEKGKSVAEDSVKRIKGESEQIRDPGARLAYVKKMAEEMDKIWLDQSGSSPSNPNHQGMEARAASAAMARDELKKLAKEMESPEVGKDATEAITKYVDKLKEEAITFGMTAEQAERYKITKMAMNEQQREAIENALKEADAIAKTTEAQRELQKAQDDAAEEAKKHADAIDDIINKLELEAQGFDDDQMLAYTLMMHGATQEMIDYAIELKHARDAQEEWTDEIEDTVQQSERLETVLASLSGSAEALGRISAFRDSLVGGKIRGGDGFGAREGRLNPMTGTIGGPVASNTQDRTIPLLTEMRDLLRQIEDQPTVEVGEEDGD